MMLKILVYAYATGTFSWRRIAKKIEEDVAFRVLSAGNFPQHRTICDFRKEYLKEFIALFVQVVQIAKAGGLIKLGRIAIDGTKIKANASRHKAMSYERMKLEEKRLEKRLRICSSSPSEPTGANSPWGIGSPLHPWLNVSPLSSSPNASASS